MDCPKLWFTSQGGQRDPGLCGFSGQSHASSKLSVPRGVTCGMHTASQEEKQGSCTCLGNPRTFSPREFRAVVESRKFRLPT